MTANIGKMPEFKTYDEAYEYFSARYREALAAGAHYSELESPAVEAMDYMMSMEEGVPVEGLKIPESLQGIIKEILQDISYTLDTSSEPLWILEVQNGSVDEVTALLFNDARIPSEKMLTFTPATDFEILIEALA